MRHRVVLDTNVLVAAAYAPESASRRIVDACVVGELVAVASAPVRREYELIVARAIRVEGYREQLASLLTGLELVEPSEPPRRIPDDPDDEKFLAAAATGRAGWIITNDRHLLVLDPCDAIRIVRPGVFARQTWESP